MITKENIDGVIKHTESRRRALYDRWEVYLPSEDYNRLYEENSGNVFNINENKIIFYKSKNFRVYPVNESFYANLNKH